MYFRLNGISFKLQAYFYNLMSLLENPSDGAIFLMQVGDALSNIY